MGRLEIQSEPCLAIQKICTCVVCYCLALVLGGATAVYALQAGGVEVGDPDPGSVVGTPFSLPMCSSGGLMVPVGLVGLEVTQSIQTMDVTNPSLINPLNNSVPLIAKKKTVARAFFDLLPIFDSCWVNGTLQATRNGVSLVPPQPAMGPAFLNSAQNGNLGVKRENLVASLNFELPDSWVTTSGSLSLTVQVTGAGGGSVSCSGCGTPVTVQVGPPTTLRLRFIKLKDPVPSPPPDATFESHINHIVSWLKRAFPTGKVEYTQREELMSDVMTDCDRAAQQAAIIRGEEETAIVERFFDDRVRYIGLFSNEGRAYIDRAGNQVPFNLGSCADYIPDLNDPSDPVGVSFGTTVPAVWPTCCWDNDGSYGDWSTGHELGHTFGLRHLQWSTPTHPDPPTAPAPPPYDPMFPSGLISESNGAFVGFDMGDTVNGSFLPMRPLPGSTWHDMMTYGQYLWLSARASDSVGNAHGGRSYEWIRNNLLSDELDTIRPAAPMGVTATDIPAIIETAMKWERVCSSEKPEVMLLCVGTLPEVVGPPKPAVRRTIRDSALAIVTLCANTAQRGQDVALCLKNTPSEDFLSFLVVRHEKECGHEFAQTSSAVTRGKFHRGDFLRVIITVNLTKRTGEFLLAHRVTQARAPLEEPEKLAYIRLLEEGDPEKAICKHSVTIKQNPDSLAGQDRKGLVDTAIRLPANVAFSKMAKMELVLPKDAGSEQVVATLKVSKAAPRVKRIKASSPAQETVLHAPITLSWDAEDPDSDKLTFTVRLSVDGGKTWRTLAVRYLGRQMVLREDQTNNLGLKASTEVLVRVSASDGFNSAEGTERFSFASAQ